MHGDISSTKPFVVGDKFGNTVEYPSQSECDAALCCILAEKFDCDPVKIDEEFRLSSLYREKWEKRADYRKATIASAIAKFKKATTSPALALVQNETKTEGNVGPKSFVMVAGDSFMLEKIPPRKVLMQYGPRRGMLFSMRSLSTRFSLGEGSEKHASG